ncbi:hypothetical protein HU200_014959 [Digitaria exilis]|uniref:Phosphatidylinositol-glycan biosynthesis class X protein n=1 Tax=Digitaria exilis TaxID=1010633 RepID=A0A835FAQ3_9POAL|nr:hypothetical protein HU200_014959 [Digitaria exilis]
MAVAGGPCLLAVALAAAWISTASSSPDQASFNYSTAQAGTSQKSINCMPCSRKYVGDEYLDALTGQHAHHRDLSEMSDSTELCKGITDDVEVPALSELRRQLVGEGSHRRLVYSLKFGACQDAMVNFLDGHDAHLVIVEKLPNGVFADPFELQHFVERKVFLDVAVFGDTNLELPSALSNRSAVEIHFDLRPSTSSNFNIVIDLPLHARYPVRSYKLPCYRYAVILKILYANRAFRFALSREVIVQPLDASGYATVEFDSPDLFLRYRKKEIQSDSCLWVLKNLEAAPVEKTAWRIPCGDEAHVGFVSSITFLSALVCSMSIVLGTLIL